ncbi:hypothetical protein JM16_007669 [Phytophthora kernoviae]|uniref:Kazal-like domain-containing protein n=1 Tax=Phytophthora kernoviae TaxID=325452 RepID=A0A8T0LP52_9STRA|nr:hypothetical protein JM16_007669 [Phytophthora kernoviae]
MMPMKFAACLVLAAVAVASATAASSSSCSFACPDVYDPVTDEKGNTYSNECYMRSAKCRDVQLLSLPSSSSSSQSTEVGNKCPDACLDVYDPVSDENGKTYSNECYMRLDKCKNKKSDTTNGAMDPALTLRNID